MLRFQDEFAKTRLSVLRLFYPNLTAEEGATVEPLLYMANTPSLEFTQVEVGLKIINKMILYKKQSKSKEDRRVLERFLVKRRSEAQQVLDSFYKNLELQGHRIQSS
jgi:hypothetical protein